MITTLSGQGGRRYPQIGSTWTTYVSRLPSVGVTATSTGGDTHDGADDRRHTEAARRRDAEYKRAREELRAQLLAAVERVTGKPPPLDQSLKQLAGIARKSEGFDYQQVLRDIEAINTAQVADALEGAAAIRAREEPAPAVDDLAILTILLIAVS